MTPLGWLAALGLTALVWWVLYRVFHAMTVADEAFSAEADASADSTAGTSPSAASSAVPSAAPVLDLDGEPITHPHLALDPDPASDSEWDRFETLEEELAEISSADSLEIGVTRCTGLLREKWGAAGAAIWTARDAERAVAHETGLLGSGNGKASGESAHGTPDSPATSMSQVFEPWMSALKAGELVCIADVSAEPDLAGKIADGIGSLAISPLGEDGLRGGMAVGWPRTLAIGPRKARWVKSAARSVDAAIERIRRGESLAAVNAQVRVLLDVGGILAREKDLAGALQALGQTLRHRLGYPVCAILLVDEEKKDLHVASMTGYGDDVYALRLPLDGPSIAATAARERRTVDVPDVSTWNGYVPGASDVRCEIACPLVFEGQLVGVLDVESPRPSAFDERDRRTLEAVAWQAALALGHFRLLAQLGERARRLELVDAMARAISSTLDARSLFQIVVDQVRAAAGAERATLVQIGAEGEEARVAAVSSVRPVAGLEAGDAISLEAFPPEQLAGPRALYVPDLESEDDAVHSRLRGSGFRSLVRVPIYIDGKLAGLFTASCEQAGAFSPAQIEILEAVAPHVSAALRNARLFEQVERSFQELSNAQGHLVQAEQLRVLGEMASGVAHNFNNVLGAILGRAQMVRARTGDPLIARELGVIEQAAMDGAATVRRLQEFTRLRTDHEFVPVDLSQVARDALALTRTWWKDRAEERGVSYGILTDFAEGVWVEGQDHELREVAVNILLNAVEAMANGGSLYLASRVTDGQAILEVTDSGVGMSDEVQKRIFHPFYSTKGPGGTGLGLSIAYGIMQRHQGKIDVTSRRGAGSTVRISLPASSSGPDLAKLTPTIEPAKFDASILLVEDEPAVLSLLTDLLEGATYKVVIARTGREAVEKLIEGWFHLVITDLGMPEMSGWELARHCRDLYPELPVILCTGWGVELDEGLVEDTGVRAVIAKPFSVVEVLSTVSRILEESPPVRRAA
jgi:signal transduction histidine kinase/ActR/RegA family two-component response regulator